MRIATAVLDFLFLDEHEETKLILGCSWMLALVGGTLLYMATGFPYVMGAAVGVVFGVFLVIPVAVLVVLIGERLASNTGDRPE